MTDFELTTSRLVLRDFTLEDEAAFVARFMRSMDEADVIERFAAWRRAEPRLNFQVAICRRDAASTLIGCCGLRREGLAAGVAEFGLELAPAWQGHYRYAIEIAEAMLAHGFGPLDLEEIVSNTTEANERVHRLARWYDATLASWGEGKVLWRFSRASWRDAMRAGRPGKRSLRRTSG